MNERGANPKPVILCMKRIKIMRLPVVNNPRKCPGAWLMACRQSCISIFNRCPCRIRRYSWPCKTQKKPVPVKQPNDLSHKQRVPQRKSSFTSSFPRWGGNKITGSHTKFPLCPILARFLAGTCFRDIRHSDRDRFSR